MISSPEYLDLWRNTEQDMISLVSWAFHDNTRYKGSHNTVDTTWLASFDQISKSDALTADLPSFMSCIKPKAIPQSILPSAQQEARIVSVIGTPSKYTFVFCRGDKEIYDLYRLVHLATGFWGKRKVLPQK
jgi:hypothetical protein